MQRWRKKSHFLSDSSSGRALALIGGFRYDHIVNKHYKHTINGQARGTEQSGGQWRENRGMWLAQVYECNKYTS